LNLSILIFGCGTPFITFVQLGQLSRCFAKA